MLRATGKKFPLTTITANEFKKDREFSVMSMHHRDEDA